MVKEKFESAEYSSLSQDESPEEISLSTTKADSLGRLKGQGKAREAEKERRKAADLSRKAQLAEQRARVQAALLELQKDAPASAKPASHPQTLVETRVIKFESEDEEETEDLPKGVQVVVFERANAITTALIDARKRLSRTKASLRKESLTKRIPAQEVVMLKAKSSIASKPKAAVAKPTAPVKPNPLRPVRLPKFSTF